MVVGKMAGKTLGTKAVVNPRRRVSMTPVACDGGMGADKREAILVLLHGLDGGLPAPHRVAVLAAGSELASMDVGVALSALGADALEIETHVAVSAGDPLMHTAKGIGRLRVMVELGCGANRPPSRRVMAVLTSDR